MLIAVAAMCALRLVLLLPWWGALLEAFGGLNGGEITGNMGLRPKVALGIGQGGEGEGLI